MPGSGSGSDVAREILGEIEVVIVAHDHDVHLSRVLVIEDVEGTVVGILHQGAKDAKDLRVGSVQVVDV